MRAAARWLGTLLILAGVAGLSLLAAGPPATSVQVVPVGDPTPPGPQAAVEPTPPAGPLAIAASAVSGDTSTGTPAEPSPSASVSFGHLLLDEYFSDNRLRWPNDPNSTAWLGSPGYRLAPRQPGRFVAVSAPLPGPVDNVVVTATFRKVGGPPGGGYGLIIRDQDPSASDGVAQTGRYLVLEAGDRGEIGIWRRDENAWVDVLSWTPSDAVHKGNEANTLEASAVGQRLTFLVNGTQVASAVDASLQGGGVGVFVGGDGNDVELDHLLVRVPDQTAMSAVAARNDVAPQQPATPNAKQASIADPTATPTSNRPVTRVVIPSISLDAPSVPVGLVRQDSAVTWDVPPFKIGYALETGGAGDPGNAVLVGHVTSRSLGNVFEHLHEVRVGDAVQLFSDQAQFTYRVVDVRTVARNDVSVVEPTATPSATLITCTGAWIPVLNDYAQRLVVRAELVQSD